MRQKIEITEQTGGRLDAYLTQELAGYTRSFIKNLISEGMVTLNGSVVKAGHKLKIGDVLEVQIPQTQTIDAIPQNIPLEILYQDADIAVINKPQGMVVHPAAGNMDGTLVNAVLFHMEDLSGIGGKQRPGIVHRLDKDTSGVIVIAKNDAAHNALSTQLKDRKMKKSYIALCHGNVKADNGTIHTGIDRHPRDRKKMAVLPSGREAVTHFTVLKRYGKYTLVEFNIETGRTHQIRVHAKHMGCPVVGDATYTKLKNGFRLDGQLLHAQKLGLYHPKTGEYMEFTAPMPAYFAKVLDQLNQNMD